jgi:hypothetical protein
VLVVSQPPPWAFLVFLLSDWWEACATSPPAADWGGGAPGPVPQERETGRGRLPPNPAAHEVTPPQAESLGTTEEIPGRHFHFQIRLQLGNSFNV